MLRSEVMSDDYLIPEPMDPKLRANAEAWWKTVMERRQAHPELIIIPSRMHMDDLVVDASIDISKFLDDIADIPNLSGES